MNCDIITNQLSAFHFGAVARNERTCLEGHLLSCPSCLGHFFDLKKDVEESIHWETQAPQEVADSIWSELHPQPMRRSPPLLRYSAMAAGLVIAIAWSIAHFGNEKRSTIRTLTDTTIDSANGVASNLSFF